MATYYVDKNRGSDSNDGLSPATAWQNLTKIDDGSAGPGDAYLLADDSEWFYGPATRIIPVSGQWTGTRANPVTIGKYSPSSQSIGAKPKIQWYVKILAGDWTYDAPNNCWQYTSPLLISNLCLLRLANSWLANRTDGGLPLASVAGRYHNAGTTLYLWAPADTNPTDYYGDVLFSPGGNGFFTISTNRGWVTIQDLEFINSSGAIYGFSGSSASVGLLAQRITARQSSYVIAAGTDVTQNLAFFVRDCDFYDWGSCCIAGFTPSGNAINEVEISKNRIYEGMNNYSQGGIYIQFNCVSPGRVFGNYAEKVKYGTLGKEADGAAIYTEVRSNNIDIYNNVVRDTHMPFQDNSGGITRWHNNYAINCHTAIKVSDQSLVGGMNFTYENNTTVVGANVPAAFGGGDSGRGVRIYAEAGQTIVNATVRNNTIINVGATFPAAILTATLVIPATRDYSYNGIFGYTNVAKREYGVTIDPSANSINAALISELGVDYKGMPLANSQLIGAGFHTTYKRDHNGVMYANPPTIGAFEYIEPRGER